MAGSKNFIIGVDTGKFLLPAAHRLDYIDPRFHGNDCSTPSICRSLTRNFERPN